MGIKDIFQAILKGANPNSAPEDIAAQADQLSQHPDAESAAKPFVANPSDFDVGVSDNTVTMNGRPESVSPPVSTMSSSQPPISTTLPPLPVTTSVPSSVTNAPSSPTKAPSSVTPPPLTPTPPPLEMPLSNDNDARNAMLQKAIKNREMAVVPTALAGAGDAIETGLRAFGVNAPTDKQAQLVGLAKQNFDETKQLFEEKLRHDPESDVSKGYRDMVAQIAPAMAKDPNFQNLSAQDIGDKLPLIDTMMKAKASEDTRKAMLAQAQSYKDINLGLRQDQQQDKLEQQARQAVTNLRGDKSLARTEEQRDAAIQVMDTMDQVKNGKLTLSEPVYYDLMAQLYRARNGVGTTAQAMQEMTQRTFKGDVMKAMTYLTGKPMTATTSGIVKNISDFATDTGNIADKLHEGYMKDHLIKPSGLEDERWQPILKTGRGISFADSRKQGSQPTNNPSPMTNTPKVIDGKSYVQDPSTGKWHEAQ